MFLSYKIFLQYFLKVCILINIIVWKINFKILRKKKNYLKKFKTNLLKRVAILTLLKICESKCAKNGFRMKKSWDK